MHQLAALRPGSTVFYVDPGVPFPETYALRDVWRYIHDHDLPYNPLRDEGYPSLGCTHCTEPAHATDNKRAGRWCGFQKTECGLHC